MNRLLVFAAVAAALGACATRPAPAPAPIREVPVSPPQPVPVPTPPPAPLPQPAGRTPCASLVKPAPAYPDRDAALRAAPGVFEQVQMLLAGRQARIARERELEQALRRCTVEPKP